MIEDQSHPYAVSHGSIEEYRAAVYFESLWLWKEKDPVCRANIARQLAEFAATLADLEAGKAAKIKEQASSEAA
ncbi:hypothetical protein [Leptolyngbya sp. NIES-2104]|uniref:hypothetical protein n=1 Tax=Leptolyngbya sp. NIES-2104 TaxID=1552121 RepID=UPI0006EC8B38|nr:hypothetical protein [Leptolyngbya sp. NIES-2104]GAP95893.1 hypothetical protein NIES2104_24190 [Leptolyngbya sp. NIES-2104]